jgi:hypothetical protein
MMKKLAAGLGAAAIAMGVAAGTAGPASAVENIKPFGQQARLLDFVTGGTTIGYTVKDLQPSADPVPHVGELYEATLIVNGYGVPATPMINMFYARAENRALYRLVGNAGPGPVPPGGSSTGKLYFEVVGMAPNSVVYNDGTRDIIAWIPGQPQGGTRP